MKRMKNLERVGAVIISAAMMTACGSSNTAKTTTAAQTTAAQTTAAETKAAKEKKKPKVTAVTNLPQIDMTKWQYNADDDVYWQVGIAYCETPADEKYETMGFFVPGGFFDAEDNGDGTFTCEMNYMNEVAGHTADEAPMILPVNTPGYAAMDAPTGYDSNFGYGTVTDYTDQGMVVAFAGCRGRDQGAPAGVTDLKAAIRYIRYNGGILPGAEQDIFCEGMSGGGAQSAILGASGDSDLYTPYLKAIGAVQGVSDAVNGAMCWCPITNLDLADEAYEWNLGSTRTGLSDEERKLSEGMAAAYVSYLNDLGIEDEMGDTLTLDKEGGSGSYYDYLKKVIETSLNHFLSDTTFPYDADSAKQGGMPGGMMGGMHGGPDGQKPDGAAPANPGKNAAAGTDAAAAGQQDYEKIDNVKRQSASGAVELSGTYATAEDYIAALNKPFQWVTYHKDTNTAEITNIEDFCKAMKPASKSLGAFDQLDCGQGENTLFGYGDGAGAHFDPILGTLVKGTEYEEAFTKDLGRTDSVGNTVDVRVDMYNPLYYLCSGYQGEGTSTVADYWRIRTGIDQGDTALTTEVNLALALSNYGPGQNVDFETVWGLGHTMAERTGGSTENFIAWVRECEGF